MSPDQVVIRPPAESLRDGFRQGVRDRTKIEFLSHGSSIFFQLETSKLAIKVLLNRRLTDPFWQTANPRAYVDSRERLGNCGQLAMPEQRDGSVAKVGERGRDSLFHGR